MQSALGDAAWMIGMERNSDVVVLQCYAPLFVNVNPGGRQWAVNLIGYDALKSFVSPSYHAQVMFANNRGDVVLPVDFATGDVKWTEPPPEGGVGLGAWETQVEYRDIVISSGSQILYRSSFPATARSWTLGKGDWAQTDVGLRQSGNVQNAAATIGSPAWRDYTISLKARKFGGSEGFLVRFHTQGPGDYLQLNLGGWGNQFHAVEKCQGGEKSRLGGRVPGAIESDRWYDIRVELRGAEIRCFLEGKLIINATDKSSQPEPLIASASRDAASGDIILKAVNTTARAQQFQIDLLGGQIRRAQSRRTNSHG